jgi:hypothetical protein
VLSLVALLLAAPLGWAWWKAGQGDRALQARMARLAPAAHGAEHPCPWLRPGAGTKPLVLLVLGQSNAANHGAESEPAEGVGGPPVTVIDGRVCMRATEPLPGGTGLHRAVWTQLQTELARAGASREVALSLLAVDGTTVDDWTRDTSPLRARLDQQLLALRGVPIDFVLWQQGEADARAGTTTQGYEAAFDRLLQHLRMRGVVAPMVVARSTRCRSGAGAEPVRLALVHLVQRHSDVLAGPDTDTLVGATREHDCHFSKAGLQAAAALWAQSLAPLLK